MKAIMENNKIIEGDCTNEQDKQDMERVKAFTDAVDNLAKEHDITDYVFFAVVNGRIDETANSFTAGGVSNYRRRIRPVFLTGFADAAKDDVAMGIMLKQGLV